MTAKLLARTGLVGCLALLVTAAPVVTSGAAWATPSPSVTPQAPTATGDVYVKYYTVAPSYQAAPENLNEIAIRFLGSAGRADDIYHLNVGRKQPDGATLTGSRQLHAGWSLVLPWDAVGDGVQNGLLPTAVPGRPGPSGAVTGGRPGTSGTLPTAGGPLAAVTPAVPARPQQGVPTATAGRGLKPLTSRSCAATTPSRKDSGWAQQRMAADRAWSRTQGEGVLVAVVDSGVAGNLPELSGRVAVGADIPSGGGRGDTDCLGSGTAMAGIIAARPVAGHTVAGGQLTGMAPGATILPLRVVSNVPQSQPANAATAIEVAVSAGAKVVAIGSYVNLSDPAVRDKIKMARDHDVVVVAPALTTATGSPASPWSGSDEVLWVAGVGPDGQPGADYLPDAVDVTAPGIDVASLGIDGTGIASSGSQYGVAFAAGAAALVRSAYPNLNAAQVVNRLEATADHTGDNLPDPHTGYGMINSDAAVTMVLAAESQTVHLDRGGSGPLRTLTIALIIVLGVAAVAALGLRSRGRSRPSAPAVAGAQPDPDPGTRS